MTVEKLVVHLNARAMEHLKVEEYIQARRMLKKAE